MEKDQELRHVCKFCNKKFLCGKALGGHIRSHVVANTAESEQKVGVRIKKNSSFGDSGVIKEPKNDEFENGQSSYGLRENPKKSWRAVDSRFPLAQDKICKQCGKGFQSLKALCGHMASHSERDKGLKDDHSWTTENQKMEIHSHSDAEAEEVLFRRRASKDKRYKNVVGKCSSFTLVNNVSSSVSEIDGQEQEEVAMCLLLLSKDSGNSVVESSDNTSVVLETKSSSIEMGIGKKESVNYIHNQDEIPQVKIGLEDSTFDDEIAQMENSDSGYFLDECAKAESDVSVDMFRRYGAFEVVRKRKYSSENLESERMMMKNGDSNAEVCNTKQKKSYECLNCKKTFKSYQALGGHRPCHKRSNACYESRCESSENNLDDSTDYRKSSAKNSSRYAEKKVKSKKNKGHVCPFCERVFKNGQALGGHKRSHFIVGHERNNNQNPVVKTEVPDPEVPNQEAPDLLDLNLLPPEANEDDQGQLFSW